MADISEKITRKSLRMKKKAAIKTIKEQAREKIHEIKIQYAENPAVQQTRQIEKEQRKALKVQRHNAKIAYNVRQVRQYSFAVDLFSAIISGTGAALSIAAIVLLVLKAVFNAPAKVLSITGFSLFGSALFIMYLMSTLYHAISPFIARKVFSRLNHIAIYVMIVGTYLSFLLTNVGGSLGWTAFGVVLGIASFLSILYAIFGERIRPLASLSYMVFCWVFTIGLGIVDLGNNLPLISQVFIVAGGITYTISAVFHSFRLSNWAHAVFHVLVLLGSVLHFFAAYFSI